MSLTLTVCHRLSRCPTDTVLVPCVRVQLEASHINILSKMDLVEGNGKDEGARSRRVERFLETDPSLLLEDLNSTTSPKFAALNEALLMLIGDFNFLLFR